MNAATPVPNADEASPLGTDVGRSEIARAEALVAELREAGRQSTAEMLQELRRAFPHSPLSFRIRALEALRRR